MPVSRSTEPGLKDLEMSGSRKGKEVAEPLSQVCVHSTPAPNEHTPTPSCFRLFYWCTMAFASLFMVLRLIWNQETLPWISTSTSLAEISYQTVPGFFIQDRGFDISEAGSVAPLKRFGLLDRSPLYWQKFSNKIAQLNQNSGPKTSYKVLFLGRHGQGFHNVAEQYYGTAAWDDFWSRMNGNGTIVWGPDAKLTALGIVQAQGVNDRWASELLLGGGIPLPTRLYSSPLSRAAHTLQISFEGITTVRPLVIEGLRERIGVHTCDQRSNATTIQTSFPGFDLEEGFTEEDKLWTADTMETDREMEARLRIVLDRIFSVEDTYMAIVAHGGSSGTILDLVGHVPHDLLTAGVVPMVIKVTCKTQCAKS